MPKCDECGKSFTQFRAAGKCPKCGAWLKVTCDNCRFTADADEFLYGGGACPKCGQHTEVPGQKKRSCFIATAVYGKDQAADVLRLQLLRDTVLVKHRLGRWFVAAYELLSPGLARAVARSATLRALARTVIVRPAARIAGRMTAANRR